MPDLAPVCAALDLIEARLQEDLTLAELAAAAGYSLYHFIRVFDQIVRHTPYDYLMRRRLSEAAGELVRGERRVCDIALDYGFNSHETFSRAFKRFTGLQPVQWRERGIIPRRSLFPAFSPAYLAHINQPGFRRPELVDRGPLILAGLMGPAACGTDAAARLWQTFGRAQGRQPERQYYGLTSFWGSAGEQAYFLAGYDASGDEFVADSLARQAAPAGRYVQVVHTAPLEALPLTWDYLYHTWLPKAGLCPGQPFELVAFGAAPPWQAQPAQVTLGLPAVEIPTNLS